VHLEMIPVFAPEAPKTMRDYYAWRGVDPFTLRGFAISKLRIQDHRGYPPLWPIRASREVFIPLRRILTSCTGGKPNMPTRLLPIYVLDQGDRGAAGSDSFAVTMSQMLQALVTSIQLKAVTHSDGSKVKNIPLTFSTIYRGMHHSFFFPDYHARKPALMTATPLHQLSPLASLHNCSTDFTNITLPSGTQTEYRGEGWYIEGDRLGDAAPRQFVYVTNLPHAGDECRHPPMTLPDWIEHHTDTPGTMGTLMGLTFPMDAWSLFSLMNQMPFHVVNTIQREQNAAKS
jgi:hypothetical protein